MNGFGLENLPWGVFRPRSGGDARIGVAFGDGILDVRAAARARMFRDCGSEVEFALSAPALVSDCRIPRSLQALLKKKRKDKGQ